MGKKDFSLTFKVPEVKHLPPDQQQSILRDCLESEEFASGSRKIRRISLISTVVILLVLLNGIHWIWIREPNTAATVIVVIATLLSSYAVLFCTQGLLLMRLARRLLRKKLKERDLASGAQV